MKRSGSFVDAFTKILLKQNSIKRDEALAIRKAFFNRSQENFDEFLLSEGLVSRTEVLNALSEYYDLPSFDAVGFFFDHQLLREFPKDFLLRNQIIPYERDENILFMVASRPNDPELLPAIGKFVSYEIQFMVGIATDITDAVSEFYDKALTDSVTDDFELQEEHNEELDLGELFVGEKDEE